MDVPGSNAHMFSTIASMGCLPLSMKLTVQLDNLDGDKDGPRSDQPRGVSIAQGVP